MDDDIIDDLATAFLNQRARIEEFGGPRVAHWMNQLLDDMIAVGHVIHAHAPTYDLRYYYKNAGHPEPYPIHDMV